jgi:heme/copper-type cytochrome/quinol oxidase subunit 2
MLLVGLLTFYRCPSLYQIQRSFRFVFVWTMFIVFLSVCLVIAVVVTAANRTDPPELVRSMGIWLAATDALILIFALFGRFKTFRAQTDSSASSTQPSSFLFSSTSSASCSARSWQSE